MTHCITQTFTRLCVSVCDLKVCKSSFEQLARQYVSEYNHEHFLMILLLIAILFFADISFSYDMCYNYLSHYPEALKSRDLMHILSVRFSHLRNKNSP